MKLNKPITNLMYKACMKASKVLIRDFGEIEKLQVSMKGAGDFVSSSDKKVEKIIINELIKPHPDYAIFSEEAGSINEKNKNNRIILDPIDGTMNFLNGIPHFAISIAYEENNELISGIIFDPIKNELFVAEKGNGAYLNNTRTRVSKNKKLKESILATGGPNPSSKKKEDIFNEFVSLSSSVSIPVRKFGSAALDLAYVACGRFDGYWQWELNLWDVAAGILIVKESGGFVDALKFDDKLPRKRNIIASNSLIHENLSKLVLKKY
jgi:myo-inositol-1(or 4)-monophosphatase